MYAKLPGGETPTPYDLRQNRETVSVGFAISVMISVVFALGLVWLLILSFDLGRLTNGISDSEDGCGRINDTIVEIKEDLLPDFQLLSEKAQPDGYAPLGPDSIVPDEHLPPAIFDAALFRGCWDAATNFPVLVSSVGFDGEFFIVCVVGSTVLDGEGEWNFHDILLFEGGAGIWRRVDGGRNTIVDAVAPPSGGEVTLIDDGVGPFYSVLKMVGSEFLNVTSDGERILFEFVPPPPPAPPPPCIGPNVTTLVDSGPDSTLIIDGIGPEMEIRQIDGQTKLCSECSGTNVATNPTNLALSLATFYRSGTWNGIFTTVLTETPVSRGEAYSFVRQRGRYIRVGNDIQAWVKWIICFRARKTPGGQPVSFSRFTFSGSILSVFDNMVFPTNPNVLHATLAPGSFLQSTFPCPASCTVGSALGHHGSAIMETNPAFPEIRIDLEPNVLLIGPAPDFCALLYEMHIFASWRTSGSP